MIPAESKAARKKLDSLTGLRFCAALFVVVYHVRDGFEGLPSPVRLFISRGYVAVPLFFALSGFVLAYTYAEHGRLRGTKGNFWLARFSRIYPIYFIAFLLFAPVAWVKVPSFLATAVSTVTLTQSWTGLFDWNTPGWSLSVEAFLYLIFPFLMPLVYRIPTRLLIPASVLGWGAALFVPVLLPPNLRAFHPLSHVSEFALGVVVFRLHSEWGWGRGIRTTLAAASLVALVALLGFVDMPELGLQTSLLAPLMGGLILGLAGTDWLSNSWLVSLGSASYSLYILQNPVHVYLKLGASLLFFHERTNDSLNGSAIFAVVYIGLSVMISLLAFRWLEDPTRKWIGRAWRTTPAAGLIQAK